MPAFFNKIQTWCTAPVFEENAVLSRPAKQKQSTNLPILSIDTRSETVSPEKATFTPISPPRPLTPRSPYAYEELLDGKSFTDSPLIGIHLRTERKGSVTSTHTMPNLAPPTTRSFSHVRSQSLTSPTYKIPTPITIPSRKAQKSIIDADETHAPSRKSSLGSIRRQGMHFEKTPISLHNAGVQESLANYRFGSRPPTLPSSPKETLVDDQKKGDDAVTSVVPARYTRSSLAGSMSTSTASSRLQSPISFESDLRPGRRPSPARNMGSIASANSLRVSSIFEQLDTDFAAVEVAQPLTQVTLADAHTLFDTAEIDNIVLKGLESISREPPKMFVAASDQVSDCLQQIMEESQEAQNRYQTSRMYRNALLRRILILTNRIELDQGPHLAQLLADAMRQTDETAISYASAQVSVERFRAGQAEHKACCASAATSKLSASYQHSRERSHNLREQVASLTAQLNRAQTEIANLQLESKQRRSRKSRKASNHIPAASITGTDHNSQRKAAQSTPLPQTHAENAKTQRRRCLSAAPFAISSLAAELERAEVAEDGQSAMFVAESPHIVDSSVLPNHSSAQNRLRTLSQPSPTVPSQFSSRLAPGRAASFDGPLTPASAFDYSDCGFVKSPRDSLASSRQSSFRRRRASQSSYTTLSGVGIGQIDEWLNLY